MKWKMGFSFPQFKIKGQVMLDRMDFKMDYQTIVKDFEEREELK